jgi:hypothetical protein
MPLAGWILTSEYTKRLVGHGFFIVHCLGVAKQLCEEVAAYDEAAMSTAQKEALKSFDLAYGLTENAFDTAADSMSREDTKHMETIAKDLRK